MRRLILLPAVALVVLMAGCSSEGGADTTTTTTSSVTTTTTTTTTTAEEGDSSPDIATVEQLIDAHGQAWIDDDPEGVGAFYAVDAVFVDLTGGRTVGREAIVEYAKVHVAVISESLRTGPAEAREDGTFAYPARVVVTGMRAGTYTGVAVVAIEDGLFTRFDLSQLTPTSD